MSVSRTKRVNYTANQRLDVVDKLAEGTTFDDTLNQYRKGLVDSNATHGRVFQGFNGTATGSTFTVATTNDHVAVDGDGNVLINPAASSLTASLISGTWNYVHAKYNETDTDADSRQKYDPSSSTEVSATLDTRIERGVLLYVTIDTAGQGDLSRFTSSSGGNKLIPLYAINVASNGTVLSTKDFRPLFSIIDVTAANQTYYTDDFDHDFAFTNDPATKGVINIRSALVALADRIKDLKPGSHWYDDANNIWSAAGTVGQITRPTGNVGIGYATSVSIPETLSVSGELLATGTITSDSLVRSDWFSADMGETTTAGYGFAGFAPDDVGIQAQSSSGSSPYSVHVNSGADVVVRLDTSNDGTNKLSVRNGLDAEVFSVQETGNISGIGNLLVTNDVTSIAGDIGTLAGSCYVNGGKVTITQPSVPTIAVGTMIEGLLIAAAGFANWNILQAGPYGDLHFASGGTSRGYLDRGIDQFVITFTGQHRNTPDASVDASNVGCIVVSKGVYNNLSMTSDIEINEALPKVALATARNQKAVFGVVSDEEDTNSREYSAGSFVSTYEKPANDSRLIINSLGEGAIWVCNINGNLENGDYITSCEAPGFGMKQDDDLLHNYTVAKITCDCDFDLNSPTYQCVEFDLNGTTYKKAFVGCTYHCG